MIRVLVAAVPQRPFQVKGVLPIMDGVSDEDENSRSI